MAILRREIKCLTGCLSVLYRNTAKSGVQLSEERHCQKEEFGEQIQ